MFKRFASAAIEASTSNANASKTGGIQVTRLANGLRVASAKAQGHFASAGVYVDTGSKHEDSETIGCSFMMDRMAFKSTQSRNATQIMNSLERMGGNVQATATREAMMYQAAVFPQDLADLMQLYGDVVKNPLFDKQELEDTKLGVEYELKEMQWKMETVLPEVVHQTAFQSRSLGSPLTIPRANLLGMQPQKLKAFHSQWYTPERMVVCGVGIQNHLKFVELVERHFGDLKETKNETTPIKPQYKGGISITDTSLAPPSPNPDDFPLTHVYIAFETMGSSDPDVYAVATLTSLMGGGGSFSAGGPGKGMYTRLYTQVLNRCSWVESCHMNSFTYNDCGLLTIHASVLPGRDVHRLVVPMLCEQLVGMTQRISDVELRRAKNQLKSNLLMSLESKLVELEDMGRQLLVQKDRMHVLQMCQRIDQLTVADLQRAARRVVFGESIQSPLGFTTADGMINHWNHSGKGNPTVVIKGPLGRNDPLLNAESTIRQWI